MSTEQEEGENHENLDHVCMACGEEQYEGDSAFAVLPCGDTWCLICLQYTFKTAWSNGSGRTPTCCQGCPEIEPTTEILDLLTPSVASRYLQARMEHKATITSYCHMCSEFIPEPFVVDGKMATCPKCEEFTCSPCGKPWHLGECVEDPDATNMKKLIKENGWKQCPNFADAVANSASYAESPEAPIVANVPILRNIMSKARKISKAREMMAPRRQICIISGTREGGIAHCGVPGRI
ncbi:hypothetical protein PG996_008080 [Apiospora saccharicola]|uniref:RING-type domain-containing protein n=1 Tax=Apiospora saccharicola TaxID=335842 RepID=A0ABR1UWW2_9PEZI